MAKKAPGYCLHRASGRAVVRINFRDYYLGEYNSKESKREYARLIAEWEASGRSVSFGYTDAKAVTVSMLVVDYRAYAAEYYPKRYNSESATIRLATDYLTDYLDIGANQFTPLKLKAVREKMLASRHFRTSKPQSRVYVNRLVSHICRMFKWGAENELVEITTSQALSNVSPLKKGRCNAPETEEVTPVDDSVMEATLEHCGPIIADMIRVQRLTAMRPAEVCSLTPAMIDRSAVTWVATLTEHKGAWRGKTREIYIGPRAAAILLPYLLRSADSPLFSPAESVAIKRSRQRAARVTPDGQGNGPGTNVAKSPARTAGDKYDTNSYRRAIHRACDSAFPPPTDCTDSEIAEWQSAHRWSPNQLRLPQQRSTPK